MATSSKVTSNKESEPVTESMPLSIKVFADGADLDAILALAELPHISGFTTNPTLMRKSGVSDYEGFSRKLLEHITDRPVSLEVFSDDIDEMDRQARRIASWGSNVYVKIPITTTTGLSTAPLVRSLSADGLALNVTALTTLDQVAVVTAALETSRSAIVSVFAGRIADTGRDPVPVMRDALGLLHANPALELLWASPREVLNIVQAQEAGCHIITVTSELLAKLPSLGRPLEDVSLDTVKMFHNDAQAAGFIL
jgi:transaldolase